MSITELRPAPAPEDAGPGRKRMVAILAALLVVLAVAATWLVAFSSVLGVRTVQVRGEQVLSADAVRAAAHITHGTPLIRLDTDAVRARVQQLAEVASAQVSTSYPSTVVITVVERTAVGYLNAGSGATLVDRTGRAFRHVKAVPRNLPRLVSATGAAAHSTTTALAQVAAALPRGILRQVQSIEALDPNAITLVLSGDRVVNWGTGARTADKARLLPVLMRGAPSQIDLSNPDQPFTR